MGAIDKLLAGFKGFRAIHYEARPQRYEQLRTKGQSPEVLIIACSDSRVDPAILLNAEPGDLFVVRNVANLVPPYAPSGLHHGTSAAIEFAVRDLKVRHAVILGHAACGGINALVQSVKGFDLSHREFIAPWVSIARPACEQALAETGADAEEHVQCAHTERGAIGLSLENLMTFPWVRERVEAGTLDLHGWWFDLQQGLLWIRDPDTGEFTPFGA